MSNGITLAELAQRCGGRLDGPADLVVRGAAPIDEAGEAEISWAAAATMAESARSSAAGALVAPEDMPDVGKPLIRCRNPRSAFARVLAAFDWRRPPAAGVHPSAVIGDDVELGEGVHVGPHVCIGAGTRIGARTVILAGAVIGSGVAIGEDTTVHPCAVVYDRVSVGSRVIVHSGAVLGADGFGFVPGGDGHEKIPHIGTVIIEDDVEIGANACVDRATCGATVVGRGSKIDNFVQVGHNVRIGPNCLLAGHVGLAGSTRLEAGVMSGGFAAVTERARVGQGSLLAAQSLVAKDVPAGSFVSGAPARPHRDQLRIQAVLQQLPALKRTVDELKERLAAMEGGAAGQ